MRHNRKLNHLGRKSNHRRAMLANMATSLIIHKKIKTTVAKAKALRIYVEPLITKSKEDSTHSRRVVFSYLQNKDAVSELFREISPKIMERPGGYTRILKIGNRVGDNAEMCIIELVDYNENLLAAKTETTAKTGKRRRRGGKKKDEEVTQASATPSDAQSDNAETEQKETEAAKEEASDEIVDKGGESAQKDTPDKADEPAKENTPEDMPEAKEEKKQDDVTDEEKKEK